MKLDPEFIPIYYGNEKVTDSYVNVYVNIEGDHDPIRFLEKKDANTQIENFRMYNDKFCYRINVKRK